MNKERFQEIRKKSDFLFIYFLESGGRERDKDFFEMALNFWVNSKGHQQNVGRKLIINYLDNLWH